MHGVQFRVPGREVNSVPKAGLDTVNAAFNDEVGSQPSGYRIQKHDGWPTSKQHGKKFHPAAIYLKSALLTVQALD